MKLQLIVAAVFALLAWGLWAYIPDVYKAGSFIISVAGLGFFIAKKHGQDVVDKFTKP